MHIQQITHPMPLDYSEQIETVDTLDRNDFVKYFLKPRRPVKFRSLMQNAPAMEKWSPEYFKSLLGHIEVGVFDNSAGMLDRSLKRAPRKMSFGDYLDLISTAPTDARLHLFNVFKHHPQLIKDIVFPAIVPHIIKALPFTFFGGAGSVARMHRDMDNAHVFLTEFWGRKRVVMFEPHYDRHLYRYPFTTHTSVDVEYPDYEKYPALHKVKGRQTVLNRGETLFMPSKYWHFIKYETAGIGFAFRSVPDIPTLLEGWVQAGIVSTIDDILRWSLGAKWYNYKKDTAHKTAASLL
ncbi:MAG: cupin-like domain-containing protein [Flavobacteriales bacterium]|nr:cupin-like domain-containing protein [Flavobacteriales bacterium]